MEIQDLVQQFVVDGNLVHTKINKQGHINQTYVCSFHTNTGMQVYTLQRINTYVFKHPEQVMENILHVTEHISKKVEGMPDAEKRCLHVVHSKSGKPYFVDEEGFTWRMYRFIEGVRTYETISDASNAYLLGKAIGNFQEQLSDFNSQILHVTIPDFHHMAFRYDQLDQAAAADVKHRLASVRPEYDFLMENRQRGAILWDGMVSGRFPSRVTHNDTKMNNVLFSEDGKEALCVIDLDTVMPGTLLFDTGDMIRTACNTAQEDETDISKVSFNTEFYRALIKGYREMAGKFLTKEENSMILESGRNITQIMAVRFLTDYLAGDVYYHIERPEHNLNRARTQIALIQSMDKVWETLQKA